MGEWVNDLLSTNGLSILYVGTFGILVICGLGIPIPEEATFLAAGYAASKFHLAFVEGRSTADVNVWMLCIAGVLGILVGDSVPFYVGKRYGMDFLKHRFVAKIMTPERIERVQGFFRRHGAKAVFAGRFVAGLRMPTFFMSASMGVTYGTFLFWDLMGALISCPTSIWVAYWFGAKAEQIMHESKVYALIGIAIIGVVGYIAWRLHHRPPTPPAPPGIAPPDAERASSENSPKVERAEVRR